MSAVTVRETVEYHRFTPSEINRSVNKKSRDFKQLIASMRKHGWIEAYPIDCVPGDKKGHYKIRGGHHRFEAAKTLGIPVRFVVGKSDISIADLEKGGKGKWTGVDYFESYCKRGVKDYLEVKQYMDETGISLGSAVSMFHGETAGSGNVMERGSAFCRGEWKVKNRVHPAIVRELVEAFKKTGYPFASLNLFVNALSKCVHWEGFNVKRMKTNAAKYTGPINRGSGLQGALQFLEDVYNFRKKERFPLAFMVNEAAAGRQARTFKNMRQKPEDLGRSYKQAHIPTVEDSRPRTKPNTETVVRNAQLVMKKIRAFQGAATKRQLVSSRVLGYGSKKEDYEAALEILVNAKAVNLVSGRGTHDEKFMISGM